MSEAIYELKETFKYAKDGEQENASFISITAPTFKQICKVAPIKQAFTAAITELQSNTLVSEDQKEVSAEDGKITGSQCIQLLYSWSGDITKVFLHAEQLFKSGVALVDGETKLTTPLIEKMNVVDFEGLVGAYIANFITPSLMDGQ